MDNEWVLVECVSSFRIRYMVEVPTGKAEWALDTVTMNEAKEFSQESLGEQIVSHRVVTEADALALCRQDNDYVTWSSHAPTTWDDEHVKSVFFTSIADIEKKE